MQFVSYQPLLLMCKSNNDETLFDNLSRPLDINSVNDSLWSDKCDYLN